MLNKYLYVFIKLFLISIITFNGFSLDVPKLQGRINDYANIIDTQTREKLKQLLIYHEEQTTNQIAILTINSLRGDVLEEFSIRTARTWALGQKDKNNGILLLIVKNDRKLRIEVGYGLEGIITDLHAMIIIKRIIVPEFKKGHYSKGVELGVKSLVDTLKSGVEEIKVDKTTMSMIKNANAKINQNDEVIISPIILQFFMILFAIILFVIGLKTHLAYQFYKKNKKLIRKKAIEKLYPDQVKSEKNAPFILFFFSIMIFSFAYLLTTLFAPSQWITLIISLNIIIFIFCIYKFYPSKKEIEEYALLRFTKKIKYQSTNGSSYGSGSSYSGRSSGGSSFSGGGGSFGGGGSSGSW